jgi:FlaA1/EpsC-like NDP-sugar epimerase
MISPFPGILDKSVYRWLSGRRKLVVYGLYGTTTAAAYAIAFLVRFELRWPTAYLGTILATLPLLITLRLLNHAFFGLATGRWRYVGVSDLLRLLGSAVAGTLMFWAALMLARLSPPVPLSVILIELLLSVHLTGGIWIGYRVLFEAMRRRTRTAAGDTKRVLIIGAGEAGTRLAHEMVTFATGYLPLGFVDDDPLKQYTRMHGVEVVGGTAQLASLVASYDPDELIIALPSLDPASLRGMVSLCEPTKVPFKVLPGIAEVLEGKVGVDQLREVCIEDLLGRDPIDLSLPALADDFKDCAVLITGAAGSIGSELARQIARHGPARMILLDQAESPLFFLELELRKNFPDVQLRPVVGDILDGELIESLFSQEPIHRTFHAAAYKHVPLMESNVREAVQNNVLGTYRVAKAAGRHRCERFVLISTDKAVRPANVMGATKSVAELLVLTAQREYPETAYMAVRFGNVLGSQGSVIPVFRQQMEAGDQLTVTHPDVSRFFMTIAEATQLVLQASILKEGKGRIAMLEMGDPVKILDLARNLIGLSGEYRDPDDRIRFIGLRPGEKLHEELVDPRELTVPSRVPKVNLVLRPQAEGVKDLAPWIDSWRLAVGDQALREALDEVWDWCSGEVPKPEEVVTTLRGV